MQLPITQIYIKLQNISQEKYHDSRNKLSWLTPFHLQAVTQWTVRQRWKKCSDLVRQSGNASVKIHCYKYKSFLWIFAQVKV